MLLLQNLILGVSKIIVGCTHRGIRSLPFPTTNATHAQNAGQRADALSHTALVHLLHRCGVYCTKCSAPNGQKRGHRRAQLASTAGSPSIDVHRFFVFCEYRWIAGLDVPSLAPE